MVSKVLPPEVQRACYLNDWGKEGATTGAQACLKSRAHKNAIRAGLKSRFKLQSICTSTKAGASIAASQKCNSVFHPGLFDQRAPLLIFSLDLGAELTRFIADDIGTFDFHTAHDFGGI